MRALLVALVLAFAAVSLAPVAAAQADCTLPWPGTTCHAEVPGGEATVHVGDPFFALFFCDAGPVACAGTIVQAEADIHPDNPLCSLVGNPLACLRPWARAHSDGVGCADDLPPGSCFEAFCTADWPPSVCHTAVADFGFRR